MAGKRRQSCRCRAHGRGGRVLYAVEKLQHGGLAYGFMVGNKTLVSALARIKSYQITAPLRRCRWRLLRRWRAITVRARYCRTVQTPPRCAGERLHEAGWMVEMPKASMYVWAKSRNRMLPWARWNLPRNCLTSEGLCLSRDWLWRLRRHACAFALIENRDRIRQAIRGIKAISVPTVYYPPAANIFTKTRNNAFARNANRSLMAPVFHCTVAFRSSGQKYRPKRWP